MVAGKNSGNMRRTPLYIIICLQLEFKIGNCHHPQRVIVIRYSKNSPDVATRNYYERTQWVTFDNRAHQFVAPALTHQPTGSMMRIYPVLVIRMLRSISSVGCTYLLMSAKCDSRVTGHIYNGGVSLKQLDNWTIGIPFDHDHDIRISRHSVYFNYRWRRVGGFRANQGPRTRDHEPIAIGMVISQQTLRVPRGRNSEKGWSNIANHLTSVHNK